MYHNTYAKQSKYITTHIGQRGRISHHLWKRTRKYHNIHWTKKENITRFIKDKEKISHYLLEVR